MGILPACLFCHNVAHKNIHLWALFSPVIFWEDSGTLRGDWTGIDNALSCIDLVVYVLLSFLGLYGRRGVVFITLEAHFSSFTYLNILNCMAFFLVQNPKKTF